MSPIPSLRNRQYSSSVAGSNSDSIDLTKFPPSFRIARTYGATSNRCSMHHRSSNVYFRIFITGCPNLLLHFFLTFTEFSFFQQTRARMILDYEFIRVCD